MSEILYKNKYFGIGITLIILIIGFIFGRMESIKSTVAQPKQESVKSERGGSFGSRWKFVNPLLDCGEIENLSNKTINDIKKEVVGFINDQKTKGVETVSVYFRDLNNGPWFGINEKEEFNPGSLLKIPIMVRVLKDAEKSPVILKQPIFVKSITDFSVQRYKPDVELLPNQTYTVSELISRMIVYSDNSSAKVLEQYMGDEQLRKSYADLGVKWPENTDYSISVRNYGSFFRVLYNASYLNEESSEQALALLASTTFAAGLRAGVPSFTPVAHKFGERPAKSGANQLHDCGIVYYPEKPYILCVMTRSSSSSSSSRASYDYLASVIAQISKIVYNAVDQEE